MKKALLLALALVLAGLPALAQQDAADKSERDRIARERAQVEARYAAQAKACRQLFAVNDCTGQARGQRREALGDLRRQEVSLNDAQRRRRGSDRMHIIEQKASSGREDEAAQKRPLAAAQVRDRAVRSGERAAARAETQAGREDKGGKAAAAPASRASHTVDESANLRRYHERIEQARQHREQVQRREAERRNPPAAPLPAAP